MLSARRPIVFSSMRSAYDHPLTDADPIRCLGCLEPGLRFDETVYPCAVYYFAWDSEDENVKFDDPPVGLTKRFVDFVNARYVEHGNTPVALIAHSMGGFFCRYYMQYVNNADLYQRCILIASPHYGSDWADGVTPLDCESILQDTSEYNIKALRRGSAHVTDMHRWPRPLDARVVCIAGTDDASYGSSITRSLRTHLMYNQGLQDSDGVVPVSSANLQGRSLAVGYHTVFRNHTTIAQLTTDQTSFSMRQLYTDEVYQLLRTYLSEGLPQSEPLP